MKQVNMHEAKTHLSRLVEEAAAGQAFVICKAGKPMVRVTPLAQSDEAAPGAAGAAARRAFESRPSGCGGGVAQARRQDAQATPCEHGDAAVAPRALG